VSEAISGHITAFFLFDVADAIDLARVQRDLGAGVAARLAPKPTTPPYVQYRQPPITFDGSAVAMPETDGFAVRFKVFDYGVFSVALTRHVEGTWADWLTFGLGCLENAALPRNAERLARALVDRTRSAITRLRPQFLAEDYFVFTVTGIEGSPPADALVASHGGTIAQLLRGERSPLSTEERDEVLRHRISYFADDVVIVTWNSAFVRDTESGAQGAIEILEFANSQLLEFRYYDELLDAELERIYPQMQQGRWLSNWLARRYSRAVRQVHSLLIDLNELTDRTENALKIVGDVYAARLFALAAARLGLNEWKASVQEKLRTLGDIYRFAVEQASMARGHFLELIVVLILVLELVLILAGAMRL
jgi:broad specificity phosphatase PhoE